MSRQSKRIINNRDKSFMANTLESTQSLVKIFISERKLKNLTAENVTEFFEKWVIKRNRLETVKPYRLNLMMFMTSKTVKYFLKDSKNLPIVRQKLKKLSNKLARTMFTDKIWAPHKAEIFELNDVAKIINYLWNLGIAEKETSIMLIFNFLSGNRVGDLFFSNWSDIKITQNKHGRWLSVPLKVSKTNPLGLKKEQITVKLKQNTIWDVENKLKILKKLKDELKFKSSKIFNNRSTASFVYHMEKGRQAVGLNGKISGHSDRNSVCKRMLLAEINPENICVSFNWTRDSQMLFRYRNDIIEKSDKGAQYELDKFDNNNNLTLFDF